MNFPDNLRYTKDHEWLKLDGNIATIGITDFAQRELGDIVYVEIETKGKAAHGSRPDLGRNAVHEMARVIDLLETRYGSLPEELLQRIASTQDVDRLHAAILQVRDLKQLEDLRL